MRKSKSDSKPDPQEKNDAPPRPARPKAAAKKKAADHPPAAEVDTPPPADDEAEEAERPPEARNNAFPIVGVGASAGGLDAFRELLGHVPQATGMAFVLVQHLDPRHESLLTGLLQAATRLPVEEASDGLVVEPNHVYVIPPNTSLGVLQGKLQVVERVVDKGKHLPVDYFLESLAEDRGGRAIGVVLSGTASDGTVGLKAIKAAGGITFAQDEDSAEYFGMPSSAIGAGCVDFVLPPREIAKEIARIAHHPYLALQRPAEAESEKGSDALNKIFALLRRRTGNDFTFYKHSTIRRRIKRRMVLHKLERIDAYARFLDSDPGEVDALFQDVLISVTGFFRDPEAFEALKKVVLPVILGDRPRNAPVRAWVAGCSTGEEAYSVAISLMEHLGERAGGASAQIFATDIDTNAIDQARSGIYPVRIAEEVGPERLRRFFTKVSDGYQVNKTIRDMCVFAVQNVIKDPPFSKLDLVCCRNLMIYLGTGLQKRVLQTFHYALQPHGFLMLGTSETIGSRTELFSLADKKNKLYTKKSVAVRVSYDFPTHPSLPEESHGSPHVPGGKGPSPLDIQLEGDRLMLARYCPPGVIVTQNLDILHFRGQTGRYLEPSPGAASLNLVKLARPELAPELRAGTHKALKAGVEICKEAVRYRYNGGERLVDIRVLPLRGGAGPDRFLMVLFERDRPMTEAAPAHTALRPREAERVKQLERELAAVREQLQSIIEDEESANEELLSANEEIQSTNEELQSTNEELETAKEELQSSNEELATVNEELENRAQELAASNNDLVNLLSNVNLPIVMLGEDLRVRQFTPQAEKLLNLIGSDLGRPISNIKPNVDIPRLEEMVAEVIDTITARTLDVRDNKGHWYSMRIRPYKTQDNRIEGVVIAFIDIDDLAGRLQQALEDERRLAAPVRDAPEAIAVMDFDGKILSWNPAAERLYGWPAEEALKLHARRLLPEDRREELEHLLHRLKDGGRVDAFDTVRLSRDGKTIPVHLSATVLRDQTGAPYAVATTERTRKQAGSGDGSEAASPEAP